MDNRTPSKQNLGNFGASLMRAIDELRASRGDDVAVEFSNILTHHLGNQALANPSVAAGGVV